jgi:DNA-binding transcriptional LysR family regulator
MLSQIDLTRTDLNLLVLFETVMRERHVGRAAERMNLSPSAVSHGLARLRMLLSDPVFIRTPRGVTPTDRALALEAPVAEILARVRGVVATSAPFEPKISSRAFTIARRMERRLCSCRHSCSLSASTRRAWTSAFVT